MNDTHPEAERVQSELLRSKSSPIMLNHEAKCPRCKYDLRSQLTTPMPFTVRCPECGNETRTAVFLGRYRSSPLDPLACAIALPWILLMLASVIGLERWFYLGVALVFRWPISLLGILVHVIAVGIFAAIRFRPQTGYNRLEVTAYYAGLALAVDVGLALIFGGIIVVMLFNFRF